MPRDRVRQWCPQRVQIRHLGSGAAAAVTAELSRPSATRSIAKVGVVRSTGGSCSCRAKGCPSVKRENRTRFDLAGAAAEARQLLADDTVVIHKGRRSRRRPSLVGGTDVWVADHLQLAIDAMQALAQHASGSLVGQLLSSYFGGFATGDPTQLPRPLVIGPYDPGGLRVGLFDAFTERDPFIEALIGRPVPRTPRYRADLRLRSSAKPRRWDTLFELHELAADLRGEARVRAVREAAPDFVSDPAAAAAVRAIAQASPTAFDELPIGRFVRAIAADDPLWNTRLGVDADFATTFQAGVFGTVGIAVWVPGDPALRRYRAPLAAHLRYLFDYRVAPWGRFPDETRRFEAKALLVGKRDAVTMPEFADLLRRNDPGRYGGEPPARTVRRLYRLSATLQRERLAFASLRALGDRTA